MSSAISVVIPTYNRARLLPRAIDSALAACAPGDEIIVADDGSTDNTAAVLAPYGASVRYLPLPHRGAGAARNAGMAEARNPLVAMLDSDDEFFPDKLLLQRAVLDARPDLVMATGDFGHRSERGGVRHHELQRWSGDQRGWDKILGPGVPFTTLAPLPPGRAPFLVHIGDFYPILVARSYIGPITMVIRRELAGPGPWYPEDLIFHFDWEGPARMARRGPIAHLDCELCWNWGHDGPRLTNTSQYLYWSEYLTMVQRLWGEDADFLLRHGTRYRQAVTNAHVKRARWLIKEGRTAGARADLRASGGGPLLYRFMAALPERCVPVGLIHGLRGVRHALHRRTAALPVGKGSAR
jgi:glycosyltransferase involved in cell wall biosynthesis